MTLFNSIEFVALKTFHNLVFMQKSVFSKTADASNIYENTEVSNLYFIFNLLS